MKRLFAAVAIKPDEGFLKSFRGLRNSLVSENIKWVEENNIHITIKFFGETEEQKIPGISERLEGITKNLSSLRFSLSGIGIFGSRYEPRVVWAGIKPHEQLAALMKETQKEMEVIGFVTDRQNIVPHLTLGRIKSLRDRQLFQKVIDSARNIQSDEICVGECILFESILRREGPQYIKLACFPFGK